MAVIKLKTGPNAKRKAQQIHAKRRACDRLGVAFTNDDLNNMAKLFTDIRFSCVLERQSCRVSKCLIYYKDVWYPVIYDKSRKSIVTILHPTMLDRSEVIHLKGHCRTFGIPFNIARTEGFDSLLQEEFHV